MEKPYGSKNRKGRNIEFAANVSYYSDDGDDLNFVEKSPARQKNPASHSFMSKNDSMMGSITNSITTDSSFSHSYHKHADEQIIQGPPPLKRTFMSDSDEEEDIDEMLLREKFPAYQKPEWRFPVERIKKNNDERCYEDLSKKFSVKNIVAQLKHGE